MSEFINTIDVLGDDAVVDGIIQRTITEFKDDQVTEVGAYAFYGCDKLETVELPNVVTLGEYAFSSCRSLFCVNFPNVIRASGWGVFGDCDALTTVTLPRLLSTTSNMFTNCPNLKTVDFSDLNDFAAWTFNGYTNPETIILRKETVVTFDSSGFKCSGYIYVPRALIEDYKVATNWSTYADQFRALEDYTVDGTTTGELDETKI